MAFAAVKPGNTCLRRSVGELRSLGGASLQEIAGSSTTGLTTSHERNVPFCDSTVSGFVVLQRISAGALRCFVLHRRDPVGRVSRYSRLALHIGKG